MGLALILAVVSFVTAAATTAYQVIQAKKMKKEAQAAADARKGFEVVTEGEPDFLPLVYGRFKIGGVRVWANTTSNYRYVAPNSDRSFQTGSGGYSGYNYSYRKWEPSGFFADTVGELYESMQLGAPQVATVNAHPGGYMNKSLSGDRNDFLCYQQALCVGPIHSVRDVIIDSARYLDDPTLGTYGEIQKTTTKKSYKGVKAALRLDFHYFGGESDSIAVTNFPTRREAIFDGMAWLTAWFRIDRDDPQFSGIPMVQAIGEGRLVRTIANGQLSTTLSYADNPAGYVYSNSPPLCMLDYMLDNENGGGYSLDEIDLDSFEAAVPICQAIAQNNVTVGGKFWRPTDGQGAIYTRDLPRYECNIVIDTSKPIRENLEAFLATMGDARLVWSNGKYRLSIQYPATNDDIELAAIITDDDLVNGEEIDITWPNAQNRFNFATVRFHNEFEDFTEDSVSWPPKYNNNFKRGIGAMNYPTGVGSWSDSKAGGRLLNQYAVWNGQNNNSNYEWILQVPPERAGNYTLEATGDDYYSINIVKMPGNTPVTSLSRNSGGFNESHVGTANINLTAGDYRITMSGRNASNEKVTKKGVAGRISNGSTILWTTRSTSYTSLLDVNESDVVYKAMLAEDNGLELETNIFYDGVTDPFHALAKAEEIVRTSRSATAYKFHYTITSFFLEPGDFIKLESHELGVGIDAPLYLRVEGVKVTGDNTCEVEATRFDYTQLAWNVKDDVYISPRNTFMQTVPQSAEIRYLPPTDTRVESSGRLECEPVSFAELGGYIFYVHKAGIDPIDNEGRPIFTEIARSPNPYIDLPTISAASAFFAVQVYSAGGRKSEYTVTDPTQAVVLSHNWLRKVLIHSTASTFTEVEAGAFSPTQITLKAINLGFENPVYDWYEGNQLIGSNVAQVVVNPFTDESKTYSLRTREAEDLDGVVAYESIQLYYASGSEPGATVGAPSGTPVAGVPAETLVSNVNAISDTITEQTFTLDQLLIDVDDLQTIYGSVASAAESANAATISAQNAETARSLAEQAELNAVAARDAAAAAQQDAEVQANAASGFASTASQEASAAQDSASAAAGSATTASTSAANALVSEGHAAASESNAAGSASSAAGYSSVSATAANQAGLSLSAMFPRGMSREAFTIDYSSPDGAAEGLPTEYVLSAGVLLHSSANSYGYGIWMRRTLPLASGKTTRITAKLRSVNASPANYVVPFYIAFNATGGYITEGVLASVTQLDSDNPQSYTWDAVHSEIMAAVPTAAFVRLGLLYNRDVSAAVIDNAVYLSALYVDDVTSEKAAAISATASASSASSAAASETVASQKASAATQSAVDANTAAGNAQSSANSAATSESNAAGSASEAASSSNIAVSARNASVNAAAAVYPRDFLQGGRFFTHALTAIDGVTTVPSLEDTGYVSFESESGGSQYARFNFPMGANTYSLYHIRTKQLWPNIAGRRYRLMVRIRPASFPSSGVVSAYCAFYGLSSLGELGYSNFGTQYTAHDDSGTALNNGSALNTGGWRTIGLECVANGDPAVPWITPNFYIDASAGDFGLVDVAYIIAEDVTERYKALDSANAAATSASTASAKATEAGQSASSATTSANTANTKAGEAGVSAANAASSANSASGSASSATSSASLAATARNYVRDNSKYQDFTTARGSDGWSQNAYSYLPLPASATVESAWDGAAFLIIDAGRYQEVYSSEFYPVDTSRHYRISSRFGAYPSVSGAENQTARFYIGVACFDGAGAPVNHGAFGSWRYALERGGQRAQGTLYSLSEIVTGEGNDSWFKFPPGTKQVKLLALMNYNVANEPNQLYTYIDYIKFEDIEAEFQSAASAAIATGQAASATASAAAALQSASLAASVSTGSLNKNPTFAAYPSGNTYPESWSHWAGGSIARVTGPDIMGTAVQITSAAGENAGLVTSEGGLQSITQGYYVLELDAQPWSGLSFQGTGLGLYLKDSNSNVTVIRGIDCNTDKLPDGSSPVWDSRFISRWRKLVYVPNTIISAILYLFHNYPVQFGDSGGTKVIRYHKASVRPATAEEIAAGVALPELKASVNQQSGALASVSGRTTAYWQLETNAGSNAEAFMSARADISTPAAAPVTAILQNGTFIDREFLKTGGSNGGWDGGMYTVEAYTNSAYVEVTAPRNAANHCMVGLSAYSEPTIYSTYRYAWYWNNVNGWYIYEEGSGVAGPFANKTTDRVSIAISTDGLATYRLNGRIVRQVAASTGATWRAAQNAYYSPAYAFRNFVFGPEAPMTRSAISLGASEIHIYNQTGAAWKRAMSILNGDVLISGNLTVNTGIYLGSGNLWRVQYASKSFLAENDESILFQANLGNVPKFQFLGDNLAPLEPGETYKLYADEATPTGCRIRLRIVTPGGSASHSLTNDTTPGTGPTRQIDKSGLPGASNNTYNIRIAGYWTGYGHYQGGGTRQPEFQP